MKDIFVPNHLHLLIKGYVLNPPKDSEELNKFLKELVNRVRMKVVIGPNSIYVSEPGNEGVTGTVTLATSHASMHVWDKNNPPMFQFDLYSCTGFNPNEVINCINDFFEIIGGNYLFINRNTDDFKEIERGSIIPLS